MILLDTNVVSETQHHRGNPRIKARVTERHADIHLSVIVLGEIRYGVALLDPGPRRTRLEQYYAVLQRDFAERILSVETAISELWGEIRARYHRSGRVLPAPDGLIAATALHHGLTLWTRNTQDFAETGVRLFNPWEG